MSESRSKGGSGKGKSVGGRRGARQDGGAGGGRGGRGREREREDTAGARRGGRGERPLSVKAKKKVVPIDAGPAGPIGGKQRRYLRGLGHRLTAVVLVGKEGVSEGLGGALAIALEQHELIKVKLGQNAPEDRHVTADAMAKLTKSELVQVLGSTVLLYRRHPTEPKIVLPR
ncbi:MAG: ribosome assembly RNA-binding protein YhbY [Deltaproteobacteria bacterium]|nr:ribosome assembly RNA-binding protein YhbY [Deltaproteobacteria bacterium]